MTEFRNLEELYNRIKPALYSKVEELKRNHISYIKEEDIWNYLKEVKWKNDTNLSLYDMVSDVLEVPDEVIDDYLKHKLNLSKRTIYFGE